MIRNTNHCETRTELNIQFEALDLRLTSDIWGYRFVLGDNMNTPTHIITDGDPGVYIHIIFCTPIQQRVQDHPPMHASSEWLSLFLGTEVRQRM